MLSKKVRLKYAREPIAVGCMIAWLILEEQATIKKNMESGAFRPCAQIKPAYYIF